MSDTPEPQRRPTPGPTPGSTPGPGTRRVEFLERGSYRQRRLRDAARLLPMFAGVLMILPLMWPRDTSDQSLTSNGMMYMFGLWLALIVIAFALSRVLKFDATEQGGKDAGQ